MLKFILILVEKTGPQKILVGKDYAKYENDDIESSILI